MTGATAAPPAKATGPTTGRRRLARRRGGRQGWGQRVSLRRRLVAGMLVLVTLGLSAAALATYLALRVFLLNRVDTELATTLRAAQSTLQAAGGSDTTDNAPLAASLRALLPAGTVLQLRDPDGTTLQVAAAGHRATGPAPAPPLPGAPAPSGGPPAAPHGKKAHPVAATRTLTGADYRLSVLALPGGQLLVAAEPLADLSATLNRLLAVEALVELAVLVLLSAGALAVVRRALRPLGLIAATAAAIAAGDRSRRVPLAASDTEVGRVAGALNRMLTENEAAFAAREGSEARLRRFVADASHELRTPLASLRGYTELLQTGDAATPADRTLALTRIESEAIRMSGLVEDLLLLARLDQGRRLRRDPVDLAALATDAVTDLRAADPTRPVALHADTQVIVAGDADRLRQVLANLLTNARQHTPPGTPVQVSVHRLGPTAVLEVADDGPGLTPSQAAQVFERFYRADPSRTRTSDGSLGAGLGLAIVAAITHGHGGHAAATSRPATGASFRVELPASLPATCRQPPSSSTPAEADQRIAAAAAVTAPANG
jgi:two-component system OmpR family sensor kinase